MPLKKFVFRHISRYICTRRIQFILQNLRVVSFSNNDDVICCFFGRGKDIFTVILILDSVKCLLYTCCL